MDRVSSVSNGPLAIISECHAQTLHQCTALRRLLLVLCEHGCDVQAQQLSLHILQHFDAAAFQNHAEEEEFLFPTLLESMAGSDAVCLRDMTSGLTQQHRVLEHMWAALRTQVSAIAGAQSAALDASAVEAFIEANQQHIEREASEMLPMAGRLFTDNELAYLRHALDGHRQPAMF
ncbi:hemerythrin domain-containing protein [Polaromonas sp. UC242_47]|uniref:hemerythrin domain-containing protein n=1 Tax=Polaromonas sp. UC242_47 TaxID=3374626 RepID=UPI0037A4E075